MGSPESGHKQIFGRPVGNSFPLPCPPPVSNTRLSVGQKLRRVSDKRFLEFLSGPVKAVSVNKFFTKPSCSLLRKYFFSSGVIYVCVIDLKGTHVLGHFYYGNEGRDKFSLCQQGQHPDPDTDEMDAL